MDESALERQIKGLLIKTDAAQDRQVLGRILEVFRKRSTQHNNRPRGLGETIMHSKWTKLAAAAAAVVVVSLAIGHLGGKKNIVFADVCRGVNRSKTITYSARSHTDNTPDLVCRVMEKDGIWRTEFLGQDRPMGDVWIVDREHSKCLCLDNTRKVAWYLGAQIRSEEDASIYDTFRSFLEIPGTAIKNLGMRQVAGHSAIGFQLTKQDSRVGLLEYSVWADPDTKLPVLVECKIDSPRYGRQILHIITDIVFDESLDDSLFDFNPPGFKIESHQPDPGLGRMQCAVKMDMILKAFRQYLNDHHGQWPDGTSDLQSYGVNPETWINPRRQIGEVGFAYVKPSGPVSDSTVVLYEVYDTWPDGINVGLANFQVQFIQSEAEFKEALRK